MSQENYLFYYNFIGYEYLLYTLRTLAVSGVGFYFIFQFPSNYSNIITILYKIINSINKLALGN